MPPAGSATRAGDTPEAGGDSCSGALVNNMISRFLGLLFLSISVASATSYALLTLERRWPDVDIVAVVNVGEVHVVRTPEGVTLESAEAAIERMMFRRNHPMDESKKATIRIYSLLPNGPDQGGRHLAPGRTFVMMKQNGVDAFFPTDPWEFQSLSADEIHWPTQNGIQMKSIDQIAQVIEEHINSLNNEGKR